MYYVISRVFDIIYAWMDYFPEKNTTTELQCTHVQDDLCAQIVGKKFFYFVEKKSINKNWYGWYAGTIPHYHVKHKYISYWYYGHLVFIISYR